MFFTTQRTPESSSPSIFQPQCMNTASLKRELWGSLPCRAGSSWAGGEGNRHCRRKGSNRSCAVLCRVSLIREGGGIAPFSPTFYKGTTPLVAHKQSLFNFILICSIIGDQNQMQSPHPAVALLCSSAWVTYTHVSTKQPKSWKCMLRWQAKTLQNPSRSWFQWVNELQATENISCWHNTPWHSLDSHMLPSPELFSAWDTREDQLPQSEKSSSRPQEGLLRLILWVISGLSQPSAFHL